MGLKEYRQKRDFNRTPEPRGGEQGTRAPRLYVIQKHAATRLHYDLRLEEAGVLKSWAVPKGPSLDPKEKRLAVQVEDHPIEYGSFEGIIPQGEYGGGTVLLWDRGHWIPEGNPATALQKGKLKFRLEGEKLQGGWTLVRMRDVSGDSEKPNWLLMKEHDETAEPQTSRDILKERPESVASQRQIDEIGNAEDRVWHSHRPTQAAEKPRPPAFQVSGVPGARVAEFPSDAQFQLTTLTDEPPTGDEWLHEIKLDGFRMQCRIEKGTAQLLTRTGQDWTHRFTTIASTAARLPVQTAILDGEIVALKTDGRSSFQSLQNALSEGNDAELVYYTFDLLYLDGRDLSRAPLEARKEALKDLLRRDTLPSRQTSTTARPPTLRYSDHVIGGGDAFYKEACRLGLEGMISKRRSAPYRPGRGQDWIKVKCLQRQEFVVGGFTEPSGSRIGLGALLLGVYDERGELQYAGRVGTGFNDRVLKQLRSKLLRLQQDRSPFHARIAGTRRGVTWVRPYLVAEVAFTEWTGDGLLRHPSFQGLREDKLPREVKRERPRPTQEVDGQKSDQTYHAPSNPPVKSTGRSNIHTGLDIAGVRLTHPGRILYPEQGLTKRDLAAYYETIAEWILPHVAGRPVMIVRCPEGQGKACFYQKYANETVPAAVKSVRIKEESRKPAPYLMIDDLQGLISLVQMGVLELHVWAARADHIETPDRMVFDLDPDEGLPWTRVVEAAKLVKRRLAALGLKSWVKTTGGKGLHVVVPLSEKQGWDDVKAFSQAVADSFVKEAPKQYTSKMSKMGRKGKIFIDYLRNSRGATAVAAYSTRARAGATVSVPIGWEELERDDLRAFSVKTVPERLASLKADPWKEFWEIRQSITAKARRDLGLK